MATFAARRPWLQRPGRVTGHCQHHHLADSGSDAVRPVDAQRVPGMLDDWFV